MRPLFWNLLLLAVLALADARAQDTTKNLPAAPGTGEWTYIGPLADAYDRIDPANDGWPTEAFSAAASKVLKSIAADLSSAPVEAVATTTVRTAPLAVPDPDLQTTHDGAVFTVRRATPDLSKARPVSGRNAFAAHLRAFAQTARAGSQEELRVELKLVRVAPDSESSARAEVLVHTACAGRQVNATWRVAWQLRKTAPPRIAALAVADFEIVDRKTETPLLTDATASVLVDLDPLTQQQLFLPTDHWRSRLPQNLGIEPVANHGVAVGDLNRDGLDDLYLCQQGGLPNRLFLQNPDGTLTDATAGSGADFMDYSAAALIVDLDNDGDRDLVVALEHRVLFLENDGTASFELAFGEAVPSQTFSLAAADFDLDSDLDVYACGYNPAFSDAGSMGEPMPYHDARNGGPNTLFRNERNWFFANATADVGLDADNTRFSFAASWQDYDNDGDPDLYVANDYGRNCLYRNDAGKFTNVAPQLGVEDTSSGMSTAWADIDRDGHMDLYVSNMFSSAGNRITFQPQFQRGADQATLADFRRHARGNALFRADGQGGFTDISVASRTTMGRWAWGSGFADLDNDTRPDLLVANGFLSAPDTDDL